MPKFEMTLKATTNPIVKVTEKRTYAFVKNRRGTRRIRFQLWAASAIMARLSIDPRTCKVLEASMRDGRNMTETVPWTRFCGPVMRIGVNCESPPAVRSCVKSRTVLSSTRSALKYSATCPIAIAMTAKPSTVIKICWPRLPCDPQGQSDVTTSATTISAAMWGRMRAAMAIPARAAPRCQTDR